MIMFQALFSVVATHSYYPSGCPDVAFLTPPDTAALLRGKRLVARARPGRLDVAIELDPGGTPRVLVAGTVLRFALGIVNPQFANFTVPVAPADDVAVYANRTVAAALDAPVASRVVGRIFSHTVSRADRPVTVSVTDMAGTSLFGAAIPATPARDHASFDLTGVGPGPLIVDEAYGDGSHVRRPIYLDPELSASTLSGMLEVTVGAGFVTTPPQFTIAFQAKEQTLTYFVVVRDYTAAAFNQLTVTDAGFTDQGRPKVMFDRVDEPACASPEYLSILKAGREGARVVAFRSATAVARRQLPLQRIQLANNGEVLFRNLPQPGPGQAVADLLVHLSKKP